MNSNILNKVRHVKPVSKNELELIETRELLSRLESLRSLQDEFYVSEVAIDLTKDERDEAIASGAIVIKNSAIWRSAWNDVKSILASREHIPRVSKKEAKKIRQEAAKKKH